MPRTRYTREISFEERHEHDGMNNAPRLLDPVHAEKLEKGISRAGGDAICGCGEVYYDHPRVVGALWATELCDGTIVKL